MDFKKMVKDEKIWIPEKDIQNIPSIIKKEYELLKESVLRDDICGALFRLKDIYEISMKLPSIFAMICISSCIENNHKFIRMSSEELKKEYEEFLSEKKKVHMESEALEKFGLVLSRLLREPLSIGSWRELIDMIVLHSAVFEIDDNLYMILLRTMKLFSVRPKKVNGENGRYEDVSHWRNKTIGHGTLLINTEDYWEQVYDLVQGLYHYFMGDENCIPLNKFYSHISIQTEPDQLSVLKVGEKRYPIFEYIYSLDDEPYFFDSYYSRQNYTEITNYLSAPKRLSNSYYQTLYSLFGVTKKGRTKKKKRQITNSTDRELYACLKGIPSYEKPTFVIDEIKDFINQYDKGVFYIQMERGMGKSTLAHRLDGRYQKGILQKDLNAFVRVYHVSDMMLRGENRTRDYFTALNYNMLSFEGGQLEIDNEEYYADGKDLRQLMQESEGEEASLAFCRYLELFRSHYEEELAECDSEDRLNLVYMIDGIDELNSDTSSILNTIPDHGWMQSMSDELVNHVYIILFSRLQEEENLPEIAKECIRISEKKATRLLRIDSQNENYRQLLKKFLFRNYKNISEDKANEIIENAQRKFLYIQPYMAMGNVVLKSGVKIAAYDVTMYYIDKLQKLYCGTSLHTLQLIISSIAVFHTITLKEICKLVLFTEVSYDVIGVFNDILPLLTTKRTDGEDMYAFANEEYEQYIYENMYSSVYEVVCRYRISLISWLKNAVKRTNAYGKQWGDYVKRTLAVDEVAKRISFCETTEEYIKGLIDLCYNSPHTFYSEVAAEELRCNVITQIRHFGYKQLHLLSVKDLDKVALIFKKQDTWRRNSFRLSYEYTQEMIRHCMENGVIDPWFEVLVSYRIDLRYEADAYDGAPRLAAFRQIVQKWKDHKHVVKYMNILVKKDMRDGKTSSYGAYLEQLLLVVKDQSLRMKLYIGLLNAYAMLADSILEQPRRREEIDNSRKEMMQSYVKEAEAYKELENYGLIKKIKEVVFNENIYDDTIVQFEELAEKVNTLEPQEYAQEVYRFRLNEERLREEQLKRYRMAEVKNYKYMMKHMKLIFDGQNGDQVFSWLNGMCINFKFFTEEHKDLLVDYLNLYDDVIKIYAKTNHTRYIRELSWGFRRFLKCYDENIRKNPIGLYDHDYADKIVDEKQEMTSWEKTYALYCSSIFEIDHRDCKNRIPMIANKFTNKFLQELYDAGEFAQYYELNKKIAKGYQTIDFRNKYILSGRFWGSRLIRNYYRWIGMRYYRSLDNKDELTPEELADWLKEEYNVLFNHISARLKNESELLHKERTFFDVDKASRGLLCLAEIIPDTICTVEDTREKLLVQLEELVKTSAHKKEVMKFVKKIKVRLFDPLEGDHAEIRG